MRERNKNHELTLKKVLSPVAINYLEKFVMIYKNIYCLIFYNFKRNKTREIYKEETGKENKVKIPILIRIKGDSSSNAHRKCHG